MRVRIPPIALGTTFLDDLDEDVEGAGLLDGRDAEAVTVVGGGHDSNGDVLVEAALAQVTDEGPAVHDGHAEIEEDEIEVFDFGEKDFESFSPVVGEEHVVTALFEDTRDDLSNPCVVLDHQHPPRRHGMWA
jgi:hypothetical protein